MSPPAPTRRTVADRSPLKQAAEDWLGFVARRGLERATQQNYRQSVKNHIVPRLGAIKLAALTSARIEKFRDDLLIDTFFIFRAPGTPSPRSSAC